jgi:toxin YoeB
MSKKIVTISPDAWVEVMELSKDNLKLVKKVLELINDINTNPFEGIGKPEPLKGNYSGMWSRRINDEHRLIYEVNENGILIVQAKGHYLDK